MMLNARHRLIAVFNNQTVQAVILLSSLLCIFFSTQLRDFHNQWFSAADLSQLYRLTSLNLNYVPGNQLFYDSALLFTPWPMFNQASIRSGVVPLWNPYNGSGIPHLANYQSAVFSLYMVPFYLFNVHVALFVAAFLKLFGIGFFMYLYLKQIRLKQAAAVLGATALMFSGFDVVWLNWTLPGVFITAPAGLYFVERIFQRVEADGSTPPRYWGSLVGLSISLLVGLLAGHPETFYLCCVLLGGYGFVRLIRLWKQHHFNKAYFPRIFRLAIEFGLAGVFAVSLAAVQLLPFAEYLSLSTASANRAEVWTTIMPVNVWPLMIFPNLLGNPASTSRIDLMAYASPPTNYNYIDSAYIGAVMLFLAALSLLLTRGPKYRGYRAFFAGAIVVWIVFSYNPLGLKAWANLLPIFSHLYFAYGYIVLLVSVACLGAMFVDYLLSMALLPRRRLALIITVAGVVFLAVSLVGATEMFKTLDWAKVTQPQQLALDLQGHLTYMSAHIWFIGLSFGLGLAATAALCLSNRRWTQTLCWLGLLAAVFLETGYLLKDYNPTTPSRDFYPTTPAINAVHEVAGSGTLLVLGAHVLTADLNMPYKFYTPNTYDAMGVKIYDDLSLDMFGAIEPGLFTNKFDELALKLYGISAIATDETGGLLGSGVTGAQAAATQLVAVGEILPGRPVSQTFTATADGLQAVQVAAVSYQRVNHCTLDFQLEQLPSGQVLNQQSISCDSVPVTDRQITFRFPAQSNSHQQRYRIVLSSADSTPGNALSVWAKIDLNYPNGVLQAGDQRLPGGLWFDFFQYDPTRYQLADQQPSYLLFRYTDSVPRYHVADSVLLAHNDSETLSLLRQRGFDPAHSVVLSNITDPSIALPAGAPLLTTSVQVVSEQPNRVQLSVSRSQPGVLVLDKTFYPGWKATVNDVAVPVLRANYAFSAIPLPAGDSRVDFFYDPDSFKLGVLVSLSSLVIGLIVIGSLWKTHSH